MEWETDKRTQKQFCHDNNINYSLFVYWRSQLLSDRGQSRTQKFKPVTVQPPEPRPSQGALILKMPNGVVLQIPDGIHKSTLSTTLEALGVKSC